MKLIIVAFIKLYQRYLCGCKSPHSCCRRGFDAATTLPFFAAVPVIFNIAGDCQHEHHDR